jgi:hypothetical protein
LAKVLKASRVKSKMVGTALAADPPGRGEVLCSRPLV